MSRLSHKTKIRQKKWHSPDIFSLSVRVPLIRPLPGQFFHIRIGESLDPFLNRPISVAQYERGLLRLIVRVVGRGTRLLSEKEPGEELTLLGPFGQGITPARRRSLIIAGGIGVAPLLFVAQYLRRKNAPFAFLYGARHMRDLILTEEIQKMSDVCAFVVEKGVRKPRTVLQELKAWFTPEYECAYACGPRAMLIALQRMELPVPVYAFCEDFLGCGCGLCLGCAIRYKGVYKRVCEDGPVFDLSGIDFNG
jgi:dihydroorotate dehydrogenase electron transfer subunit